MLLLKNFRKMGRSPLLKNSFLYLVATISIRATSFLLLPFYSHLVSPKEYGYVYMVSATSTLFNMIMQFSMHACISRFFFDCEDEKSVNRLYSTIVLFITINAAIIFVLLWFFNRQLSSLINLPVIYFKLTLIISFLGVFYNAILALLYVKQNAKKVSITSICIGIFQIFIQLLLVVHLEDKAMALIGTLCLNSILTFIIFLIYSKPFFTVNFDFSRAKKYVYYSFSQFPSDVSGWFVKFTDRLFINKYIGVASTGIYGVGCTVGQIPAILFMSLNSALVPYLYGKYRDMNNGIEDSEHELVKTVAIVSSSLMILITVLIVLSNNIISLLAPEYASALLVIIVMLMTSLVDCYRIVYMQPLSYNIKYTKVKSLIWLISAIFNVLLNIYLIPKYGIYGACFSSLTSYFFTLVLILYFSNKAIPIHYDWSSWVKVFLLSLIMLLLLFLDDGLGTLVLKMIIIIIYVFVALRILNVVSYKNIYSYVKVLFNK